ncbi:hydroxyacylglutathione hydrolase [Candidimonas sp. SYP-B2681]|uniref:FAD/NAD(P)-binding protein n=1 Tax=Candidimonas sp. SYP-B2681 TaxID=2497686 RepID=UPI000F888C82|nr:FAD/NAD(P)-binding protein [Candidimonas sp. SYP-B2681]RTZ41512.1 hydroxyacylglutathione hydrolase [Candidimonas sp. SYP-B2681]
MKIVSDLAIVGGGSTATSFIAQLIALLEQAGINSPLHVRVFEPLSRVGPGEPYAEDLPTNLLNVPAGKMSAYAEDREHFFKWLKVKGPSTWQRYGITEIDPTAFLPRPLFGEYLGDVWADLNARAAQIGIGIHQVRTRVNSVDLDTEEGTVLLGTDVGVYVAHRVVLCNGNLPSTAFAGLSGRPGYFHNPYPVTTLASQIGRNASVAVIGTSLSAVDVIVALKESGHTGFMLAASRNGRLPSVRSAVSPPTPISPPCVEDIIPLVKAGKDGLTLEDVFGFLKGRLAQAGSTVDLDDIVGYARPGEEPVDVLIREISASASRPRVWQSVAISLNNTIEHVWRLLSEKERQRFYAEWRSLWMARRSTFPMSNALKIKRYAETGLLHISAGFQQCVARQGAADGFEVRICDASGQAHSSYLIDYVVNATGLSTNVVTSDDPIVQSLLTKGLAVSNPYGGFQLDFDSGCLIDAKGAIVENISLIGSLAGGTYFWTTSLDVNARLALDQARRIVGKLTAACGG